MFRIGTKLRLAAGLVAGLASLSAGPLRAESTPSGFAMLDESVGVVVTGLAGVPDRVAQEIVAGFVAGLNETRSGPVVHDLLNASRVLIVRGYPAAVRGSQPALVIDWRVSIDGGADIGALYSIYDAVGNTAEWLDLEGAAATALGRDAAERFRSQLLTEALRLTTGDGE